MTPQFYRAPAYRSVATHLAHSSVYAFPGSIHYRIGYGSAVLPSLSRHLPRHNNNLLTTGRLPTLLHLRSSRLRYLDI